jgi:hypothetical protein
MKIGDLSASTGKLRSATEGLARAWIDAQEAWHDAASRQFREQYLEALEPLVKSAMEAMNRLAVVFSDAERALEE